MQHPRLALCMCTCVPMLSMKGSQTHVLAQDKICSENNLTLVEIFTVTLNFD